MRIRKNALYLSTAERENFLSAVLTLKNTIVNPGAPAAQQISIYDQFVALHRYVVSINVPGFGVVNVGHGNAGFCAWHRYYVLRFEQALQAVDSSVMLPYWDWTDAVGTQNVLLQDDFLGPNGGAGGVGGGTVQSGYFAFNAPGVLPAWWPAGLAGWRIRSDLTAGLGTTLRRTVGSFASLPDQSLIDDLLGKAGFEGAGEFRETLEQAPLHSAIHNWIGGHMGEHVSPNDPLFFLHHCNVDRLWAMWQIDGHGGAAFYPAAGEPGGHNLNDPMWPWVGATPGYSSNNEQPNIVLPDFTGEPIQTPADVLDHHALNYAYDTEPVIGVALDRTGSMLGPTPDPLTGMAPNIPKWDAARQGVSFFLQDCEAAYAAREAYVTAGVQTFRSLLGNQFEQVFAPGTPYGLIKNGTSFSRATYDANVAGLTASGGTPIAGALSNTESTLVRPPFGNQPAQQRRYLAILTDGIETSPPLLNTLAAGAFPHTVIFAMGFGIGDGWDGVDYATLANVVAKGEDDPNVPNQVFHGDDAGVIDKFFTNALASSIGYAPGMDPRFELFPGEHVHFPIDVTDAEQAFMIAAQGFDFTDRNWEFCLMDPQGVHCCDTRPSHAHSHGHEGAPPHDHGTHGEASAPQHPTGHAAHEHGGHEHAPEIDPPESMTDPAAHDQHTSGEACPYFVTLRRHRGRCTIFVHRSGAPAENWVGRWALMAFYRPASGKAVMLMPGIEDFLVPVGAPPVRGPVFLRYNQPVSQRTPVRVLPGRPRHRLDMSFAAPSTRVVGDPCTLSIQVFHRTTLRPRLWTQATAIFAGQDIELQIDLGIPSGAKVAELVTAARLVAPAFSIGNILADVATIPADQRSRYLDTAGMQLAFDELRFLADYEKAKPGAFPLRDEEVIFQPANRGDLRATIRKCAHPGIHRIVVYVEGVVDLPYGECCHEGPQRFSRVLQLDVAVGIQPAPEKSQPVLFWIAPDRFVIAATPTDALGNIAAPSRVRPLVAIRDTAVTGKLENPYTGTLRLVFQLRGENVRPCEDGQSLATRAVVVDDAGEPQLELAPREKITAVIRVGDTSMPVMVPAWIEDRRSSEVHPAGSEAAMAIPLDARAIAKRAKSARHPRKC